MHWCHLTTVFCIAQKCKYYETILLQSSMQSTTIALTNPRQKFLLADFNSEICRLTRLPQLYLKLRARQDLT